MRLITEVFNNKRDVTAYINENGIQKEDVLAIFQEKDGTFTLMYYAE